MAFRFPHPFENVVDAIRDAADPDTPADGSLVTQLMNENNHAVEDRLAEPVLDTVFEVQTGSFAGSTTPSFDMVVPLTRGGLWSLSCLMYVDGSTDDTPSATKVPYVYLDIAGPALGIASFNNALEMIDSPSDGTHIVQGTCSGTVLYNADSAVDITVSARAGGFRPILWKDYASATVRLWGVRLGPVSPGLG